MGTFHQNKHEWHGITLVVDTVGDEVFVGRCDDMDAREVILLDVGHHRDGEDGKSKDDYIQAAVKFGTWKRHDRVVLPLAQVASVKPLGEYAEE